MLIRAAKSASMPVFSQIYLIYNGLELEFRRDLSKPSESTTMDAFLQELEDNKEIWWDIGARSGRVGFQAANRTGNQRPYGMQAQYTPGSYIRPAGQVFGGQPSGFGNQSFAPRQPFISQSSSFNPNRFPSQYGQQYQNQNRAYQPQRPWQDDYQARNPQSNNPTANVNRQTQPPPFGQPGNPSGYSNQNRNPGFQPNRTTLPFRPNPDPQGARPPFQPCSQQPYPNRQFQPQKQRVYHGSEEDQENYNPEQGEYHAPVDSDEAFDTGHEINDSFFGQSTDDKQPEHDSEYEAHNYFVEAPATRVYQCKRCTSTIIL